MDTKEFEEYLKSAKTFKTKFEVPKLNTSGNYTLVDKARIEYFFDYQYGSAGKFVLSITTKDAKQKHQLRLGGIQLIRVDINGAPHMSTETGELINNHIHIFYPDGTKVYALPEYDKKLYQSTNFIDILKDFCLHCNIDISGTVMQEEF